MNFHLKNKSRVVVLVVALSLIGSTGCISYLIQPSHQDSGAQDKPQKEETKVERDKRNSEIKQEARQKYEKYYDDFAKEAAEGDLLAKTIIGLEYLKTQGRFPRDIPKGLALIQSAVDANFPNAEYVYGWLLIRGSSDNFQIKINLDKDELLKNPQKGLEMLARAASKICVTQPLLSQYSEIPALDLSTLYREGKYIQKNEKLADLWLARNILHCANDRDMIRKLKLAKDSDTSISINTLTFTLLTDQRDRTKHAAELAAKMPPNEVLLAQEKAEELRRAVRQSEQLYPDPKTYTGIK